MYISAELAHSRSPHLDKLPRITASLYCLSAISTPSSGESGVLSGIERKRSTVCACVCVCYIPVLLETALVGNSAWRVSTWIIITHVYSLQ